MNSVVSIPRKGEEASLRREEVFAVALLALVLLEAATPWEHSGFPPYFVVVEETISFTGPDDEGLPLPLSTKCRDFARGARLR